MKAEDGFMKVANTADLMIWTSGQDFNTYWFNNARSLFTGKNLENNFMHGWMHGIHPSDKKQYLLHHFSCFEKRINFQCAYRLLRHDNQYQWMVEVGSPRVINNNFEGYIGFCVENTFFEDQKKVTELNRTLLINKFAPNSPLTKKEKQVLTLFSEGLSGPEIAKMLCISRHTVTHHKKSIFNKLAATNTLKAINIARELQLI